MGTEPEVAGICEVSAATSNGGQTEDHDFWLQLGSRRVAGLHSFISYAHRDEVNSHGKISLIPGKVKAEYELQTVRELNLFFAEDDVDGLQWGRRMIPHF